MNKKIDVTSKLVVDLFTIFATFRFNVNSAWKMILL